MSIVRWGIVLGANLALFLGGTLQAATLEQTDVRYEYKKWVDGELVEDTTTPPGGDDTLIAPEAVPAEFSAFATVDADATCPPGDTACTANFASVAGAFASIEAEGDEQIGDPVTYCAVWEGFVEATADPDTAAAAASGGGERISTVVAPNTATADTEKPAYVAVNGTEFPLKKITVDAPEDDSDTEMYHRQLDVKIGDELIAQVTVVAAATAPPDGSASASASGSIVVTQGECPRPDHFLCYDAKGEGSLRLDVDLLDQLGFDDSVRVGGAKLFCNPVDKNGEGVIDAQSRLTCYRIWAEKDWRYWWLPRKPKETVAVENQFGPQTLELGNARLLCVPTEQIEVDE